MSSLLATTVTDPSVASIVAGLALVAALVGALHGALTVARRRSPRLAAVLAWLGDDGPDSDRPRGTHPATRCNGTRLHSGRVEHRSPVPCSIHRP